jgi:hypothetical protein
MVVSLGVAMVNCGYGAGLVWVIMDGLMVAENGDAVI